MQKTVFCILAIVAVACGLGFNPVNYDNSAVLSPNLFTIYWNVNLATDTIYLALVVNGTGWVSFGLGDPTAGAMQGGDIVVVFYDALREQATVQDHYMTDYYGSFIDTCNNWNLISATQVLGFTTIELSRTMSLSSTEDRPFLPGPLHTLWAVGPTQPYVYHGKTTRNFNTVTYYAPQPNTTITETNLMQQTIKMSSLIPNITTSFGCQAFPIPAAITDGSIVRFDVILATGGATKLVVEFAVYGCSATSAYAQNFQAGGQCPSSPAMPSWGNPASGCTILGFVYERGTLFYEFPPTIGIRVGNAVPYAAAFLVIESRYNNAAAVAGVIDNTGVLVTYTTTPRANDAAAMVLGDPLYQFQTPVQPLLMRFWAESECPPACTSKWPAPVHVFGTMPHMRNTGASCFTTQFRNNQFIGIVGRTDFFHGGNHIVYPSNSTILPGDRLNTHCSYQTNGNGDQTPKTAPIPFSAASTGEACWQLLYYYPVAVLPTTGTPIMICGHTFANGADITACGNNDPVNGVINVPNPETPDPVTDHPQAFGSNAPQSLCPNASASGIAVNAFLLLLGLVSLML